MSDVDEQVSALTKAVHDIDASRRVGWARGYEATSKLDEALRSLNMMRAERDLYRRHASLVHGVLRTVLNAAQVRALMRALKVDEIAVKAVLDGGALKHGKDIGHNLIGEDEAWADLRESARGLMAVKAKGSDRLFRAARTSERESLARRYGFVTVNQMLAHLDATEQATDPR